METPLTILYTHRLRGDLETLPRLYSFLRQLEAHYREAPVQVCADDPAPPAGRVLRLDLGESCAPEVWHCSASSGRSTLVLLDGMGFDAARVENARATRAQMGDSVRLALVDDENPYALDEVLITGDERRGGTLAKQAQTRPMTLQITLSPADAAHLDGDTLHLAALTGSQQVGVAVLTRLIGRWALTTSEIHDLPRRIQPDPTIAASVDFVLGEARYAQKRKST